MFNKKGFTLIELLVVIAILGILASVVLVAINPAQRIAEANDSGVRSDVSQVATAVEACYTAKGGGNYTACNASTEMTGGGFLKTFPSSVTIVSAAADANVAAYGTITATSATCDSGTGATKYYVYRSATGRTTTECLGSAPTAP